MNMKAFLKENNKKVTIVDYIATTRIIDPETGEPPLWQLKILSVEDFERLRDKHKIKKVVNNKIQVDFDEKKFSEEFVTSCIVYPKLTDVELQESYGVMGEYALLKEILTTGEFLALEEEINKLHSYDAKREEDTKIIKK